MSGDAQVESRASSSSNYRLACPGQNDCLALRDCPQMLVEITTRCYNSDRSLFCGVNQNFEPFVCCPQYFQQQPPYVSESTNHLNQNQNDPNKFKDSCGKSLIQGTFYKKLGAYPFAARIGFKSKRDRFFDSIQFHLIIFLQLKKQHMHEIGSYNDYLHFFCRLITMQ